MRITRTPARRSGLDRSVDFEKLSVSWDEQSKSVVMQERYAGDFDDSMSRYHYRFEIPLSDACKVLDCLAESEDKSEAVSEGVAPSLRSLLKLAASAVLTKPPIGELRERMEHLEELLEGIRRGGPDPGGNLESGV